MIACHDSKIKDKTPQEVDSSLYFKLTVFVNLTQARITWEEGASTDELSPSDCLVWGTFLIIDWKGET